MKQGIKGMFSKTVIIVLVLVVAFTAMGITYASRNDNLQLDLGGQVSAQCCDNSGFSWAISNDDGKVDKVNNVPVDPGDNKKDPQEPQTQGQPCARYNYDVAKTTATRNNAENITVKLTNAYPSYDPTVFYGIKNFGNDNLIIKYMDVKVIQGNQADIEYHIGGVSVGQIIAKATEITGKLDIHIKPTALQNSKYQIKQTISLYNIPCEEGGTVSFWKKWNYRYTQKQVLGFLQAIDAASNWLGPTTVGSMQTMLTNAEKSGATMQNKFLGQYLALRLNVASMRLYETTAHNVTCKDPGNYLGLSNPACASLSQIISAIESKFGTSPAQDKLEIMKNICEAINKMEI